MVAGGFSGLMVAMMLIGGGSDLLDFISVKDYWAAQKVEVAAENMLAELAAGEGGDVAALIAQLGARAHKDREEAQRWLRAMGPAVLAQVREATKSPDPEVAVRAKALVGQLAGGSGSRSVRRLMAIRALGELRDAKALPALRKLTDSKALFEADYARRAIAAIEGKGYKRPGPPAKGLASDLWLLPANCAAVGQAVLLESKPAHPAQTVRDLAAMMPGQDAGTVTARISKELISVADKIGNVRLYGVTFGVSDDLSERTGRVVVVLRGLYDAGALRALLVKEGTKCERVGKREVFRPEREVALVLPSNERLVFMGGESKVPLAVGDMLAALEAGKGHLAENGAMVGLIKSADTTGGVWGVVRVCEAYREASLLAPFETVVLSTKRQAGRMDFTLKAVGGDPEKVRQAVTEFNALMAEGREQMTNVVEMMPGAKPIADFVGTIKAKADGATATATARLKGEPADLFKPFMFFVGASPVKEPQAMDAPVVVEEDITRPAPDP